MILDPKKYWADMVGNIHTIAYMCTNNPMSPSDG